MKDLETRKSSPDKRFYEIIASRALSYEARVIPHDHPNFTHLRKLLAADYVKHGIVNPEQLNNKGLIPDHYVEQSVYFDTVHKGEKPSPKNEGFLVGGRFILPDKEHGLYSLQVHIDEFDSDIQSDLKDLFKRNSNGIAELATHYKSSEASPYSLIALYRGMAEYSVEHGIEKWVIGLRPTKVDEYTKFLGEAIQPAGTEVHLGDMKRTFVPFVIDVSKVKGLLTKQDVGNTAVASSVKVA